MCYILAPKEINYLFGMKTVEILTDVHHVFGAQSGQKTVVFSLYYIHLRKKKNRRELRAFFMLKPANVW